MTPFRLVDAAEVAGVAFGVAVFVTGIVLRIARRKRLYDVPNERSSHTVPTPRSGGVGMVAGIAAALLGQRAGPQVYAFLAIACLLGLRDDLRALRPSTKMLGLVVAAVAGAFVARVEVVHDVPFVGELSLGVLVWPLTVFWLSCYANSFNFMDGIDGIASLTAAVSAGTFVLAGIGGDDRQVTVLALAIFGASLGFLPWNFPKARIFMGDAGSLPLGMSLALCAVLANASGALAFPASVLLLGPFLFDVTFTLVRRVIEGKRIGEAHREHLYQRLSRLWGSHAKVSVLYAGFSVATGVLALTYRDRGDLGRVLSLAAPLLAMLVFAAFVLAADRKRGS